MRLVLDTNILLVSIGKKSNYRPIWSAFIEGRFQLVLSEDIIHEYEEILIERSAPGVAEIVLEIFVESPDVILQNIFYKWNAISADPDDNKFYDIAVASGADFLVTNDAHFNAVKGNAFPVVRIISAEDFLKIINQL